MAHDGTPTAGGLLGTRRRRGRARRPVAVVAAATLVAALAQGVAVAPVAQGAPVGQGFNLNASDLRFILKQINISERHAATQTAANPCGTLLGPDTNQIPAGGVGVTLPWGLRTVDGSCNNIEGGQDTFGTADQPFPRLVPKRLRPAEDGTSYATNGSVRDSRPRVISNLVVDQTAANPAAVAAAGSDPVVTPSGAFEIPNVAPDVGLSAPYNSWFTLFGQFFDHGLDLVNKGGNGTVVIPLQPDDPQFRAGSPTNFMALSRATHSGNHEAVNQTSPFVDQSQTYTSHPSHQVFLREYVASASGPVGTGALLTGPGGGMGTWADVKVQARDLLGIALSDADVLNLPLLKTDPYGRFVRGPNGFPQLVVNTAGDLVEGNPASPVPAAGALRSGHAFLDDIAHTAVPRGDADPDSTIGGTRPAGTYDDELLDAHFVAGDGRVNENIGLTAVHHVFHSEHNRLVGEIDTMLAAAPFTDAERAAWRSTAGPAGWDYAERLFQAARFVTEMEYQHLAFEEFIRKVQPMVNPFGEGGTGYNAGIDPAIVAEFAHAVYRFGHSMLTESVDRVTASGARRDMQLLDAFLNPPAFLAGSAGPEQAAGDIVRGMTRQVGNELDEFVTEALRNQLLGLPLDLATLNISRARDTGIPTLNEARRAFFARTDNSALTPYESWADLSFSLKHPESLPNFVAAYGTHETVTGATTLTAKRAAANALLFGTDGPDREPGTADDIPASAVPDDAFAFLNGTAYEGVTDPDTGATTGAHTRWVSTAGGVTTTGVDLIDLWVGGLAEKQMVFGGLLGPTFNYVFEQQTEALQDGDRFYYLSRTAGLNLLTQLEGNSFAELIQRNTDVSGLPADTFSRPDLMFDLANLGTSGPILDDPATDYNEAALLTRMPDGTIRYGGPAHVVFNGTAGNNRVRSSEGDDTIRGNDGDDRMEGGDGADNLIGGLGDDILTDLFGDDTLKGGDGNDTLSSGQGFGGDLNQGGRGNDMIIGGNDATETFAGPGDDFVFAGAGEDTVFGDDGDDWIEGGTGPFNLLQGDNGAPFQDDPNEPGHDVLIGYGGEQDYDGEGGDDIMLLGTGIQRNEGMLGFDFTTHKLDRLPGDSDMRITGLLPPAVETNRDRFDMVESLSGWTFDDVLRGDSREAADMVGHELDAAGIARVAGLAALLPAGATGFTGGNLLLGGDGSDLIEGRGGDDLIDGNAWLDVQLRAPDLANPGSTRLHDGLTTLRADVLAGRINPGSISIVRSIRTATAAATDTALFSGPRANYTVTTTGGVTTVADTVGTDGTDTLRNIEQLRFADLTIPTPGETTVTAPGAATVTGVVAGDASATVSFTAPTNDGGSPITGFEVVTTSVGTAPAPPPVTVGPAATTAVVTGLTNGSAFTFQVRALNAAGAGPLSTASTPVTPAASPATTVPGAPTIGGATAGNASATVRWTAPASDGGSPLAGYRVQVRTGTTVVRTVTVAPTVTETVVPNLTNGTAYRFRVRAFNAVGNGPFSALTAAVTPAGTSATVPTAPRSVTATAGTPGGAVTARAAWLPPASTGGAPITGYVVRALRMGVGGAVLSTTTSAVRPAGARALTMNLPQAGNYRFTVQAQNQVGSGPQSARSNQVAGR